MKLALGVLGLAIVLAACGGGDGQEAPGDAVKRQYDLLSKGQWGRSWDELHPGQQAMVSRSQFSDCYQASATGFEIEDIKVLEVFDDPLDVEGIPEKTSKAVTFSAKVNGTEETVTVHVIDVGGEWRWILQSRAIAEIQAGDC